jgi:hypothetical protein
MALMGSGIPFGRSRVYLEQELELESKVALGVLFTYSIRMVVICACLSPKAVVFTL